HGRQKLRLGDAPRPLLAEEGSPLSQVRDQLAQEGRRALGGNLVHGPRARAVSLCHWLPTLSCLPWVCRSIPGKSCAASDGQARMSCRIVLVAGVGTLLRSVTAPRARSVVCARRRLGRSVAFPFGDGVTEDTLLGQSGGGSAASSAPWRSANGTRGGRPPGRKEAHRCASSYSRLRRSLNTYKRGTSPSRCRF